jgi:hypothetical protein
VPAALANTGWPALMFRVDLVGGGVDQAQDGGDHPRDGEVGTQSTLIATEGDDGLQPLTGRVVLPVEGPGSKLGDRVGAQRF